MTVSPPLAAVSQAYEASFWERAEGAEAAQRQPVRLVVFDFDETLTLATFFPKGQVFLPEQAHLIVEANFSTPFVPNGDRVLKLKRLLRALAFDKGDPQKRSHALVVLSKNPSGTDPIRRILQLAGLDGLFDAVWCMPSGAQREHGSWRNDAGGWTPFQPPFSDVPLHKADVLAHVVQRPELWLPQLQQDDGGLSELLQTGISLEQVVLIDDQCSNFNSSSGSKVLRCCCVAKYDAHHTGMGGLGAHSDLDYSRLLHFVRAPWDFSGGRLPPDCAEMSWNDEEEDTPPPPKAEEPRPIALNVTKSVQEDVDSFLLSKVMDGFGLLGLGTLFGLPDSDILYGQMA